MLYQFFAPGVRIEFRGSVFTGVCLKNPTGIAGTSLTEIMSQRGKTYCGQEDNKISKQCNKGDIRGSYLTGQIYGGREGYVTWESQSILLSFEFLQEWDVQYDQKTGIRMSLSTHRYGGPKHTRTM